ncbi:MAG: hypothetical protein FWH26_04490 [Oscillospiraceae bacterium]|nr:hypothetical protein [Oscillospiraceae bacterium]
MYVDPTGMASRSFQNLILAIDIVFIALLGLGLADAVRVGDVILTASDVSQNDDQLFEFLISLRDASNGLIAGNERGGNFHFEFDTAFLYTSKAVCRAMGSYLSPHMGMSKSAIQNEIYFHAMMFYSYNNLLPILEDYGILELAGYNDLQAFRNAAGETQLHNNGDPRTWLNPAATVVWIISIGLR